MSPVQGARQALCDLDHLNVILLDADDAGLQAKVALSLLTLRPLGGHIPLLLWADEALLLENLPHGIRSSDANFTTVLQEPEVRAGDVDDDHQHLDPCVSEALDCQYLLLDLVEQLVRRLPLVLDQGPEFRSQLDEALRADHEVQDEVLVVVLDQPLRDYQEAGSLQCPALRAELGDRLLHGRTRLEASHGILPEGRVFEERHLHLSEEVALAVRAEDEHGDEAVVFRPTCHLGVVNFSHQKDFVHPQHSVEGHPLLVATQIPLGHALEGGPHLVGLRVLQLEVLFHEFESLHPQRALKEGVETTNVHPSASRLCTGSLRLSLVRRLARLLCDDHLDSCRLGDSCLRDRQLLAGDHDGLPLLGSKRSLDCLLRRSRPRALRRQLGRHGLVGRLHRCSSAGFARAPLP
mmetsp:Transcript_68622/g.155526  ORF Transcript_68622/g.155526 Transcript_68622/m.155526 type:complete len:407 (+) Transcript_68622:517-1737(+)